MMDKPPADFRLLQFGAKLGTSPEAQHDIERDRARAMRYVLKMDDLMEKLNFELKAAENRQLPTLLAVMIGAEFTVRWCGTMYVQALTGPDDHPDKLKTIQECEEFFDTLQQSFADLFKHIVSSAKQQAIEAGFDV